MHNKVVICLDNTFNSSELTVGRVYETILNESQFEKGFVFVINDELEVKKYKFGRFMYLKDYYNSLAEYKCCGNCDSHDTSVQISYDSEKYFELYIKCNNCKNKFTDEQLSVMNDEFKLEYNLAQNKSNKNIVERRYKESCCLCGNENVTIGSKSYKNGADTFYLHCQSCDFNFVNKEISSLNFQIRKSVDGNEK